VGIYETRDATTNAKTYGNERVSLRKFYTIVVYRFKGRDCIGDSVDPDEPKARPLAHQDQQNRQYNLHSLHCLQTRISPNPYWMNDRPEKRKAEESKPIF
jgi:hypothetical protein